MTAKELYEQLKAEGLENLPLYSNSFFLELDNHYDVSLVVGWSENTDNFIFLETED